MMMEKGMSKVEEVKDKADTIFGYRQPGHIIKAVGWGLHYFPGHCSLTEPLYAIPIIAPLLFKLGILRAVKEYRTLAWRLLREGKLKPGSLRG
jgi:hypothetical protein